MSNKRKIIKTVVAVVIIAIAAFYLIGQAAKSSWAYYCDVDEFLQEPKIGSIVRLAGIVKDGSIVKESAGNKIAFILSGQKNSIEVGYEGIVAKNFQANREVVVEGVMGKDGKFKAKQIITRCESKYKTKLKKSL